VPADVKHAYRLSQQLVREIVDGDLQPGTMLRPEKEMTEQYGVGRGSLREALRHLELQGVLTIRPGSRGGPQVAMPGITNLASSLCLLLTMSRAQVREVVEAVVAIAPSLAHLAAENADTSDIVALHTCLSRLEEHLRRRDRDAFMEDDLRFRELLATASGNGMLSALYGALMEIVTATTPGVVYSFPQMKYVAGMRSKLIGALGSQDAPAARAIMREQCVAWSNVLERHHAEALDGMVRWDEPDQTAHR
jgi:GntR family transcriptional repressor for pyruvate dehydrogenase complex